MPKLNKSIMKSSLILMLTALFIFPFFVGAQVQIGQDIDGFTAGDNFGKQVKIAANGTILGVLSNNSTGNVHVYQNVGGNWELYGTDSEGGHFDGIVASGLDLSEDGHTLVLGGNGTVKVFTYTSGIWTQKGSDVPNSTSDSSFGAGVCLSSDGNSIAVSSPEYEYRYARYIPPPITTKGLVQVFNYKSGNWNQIGNDILAGHWLISATSFSLSSDATRVAIVNNTSVKVYENINDVWTTIGNDIIGVDGTNKTVRLSADGNKVAIGDPFNSLYGSSFGLVKIYTYESGNWIQFGNDITGNSVNDYCGYNLSLSSDGIIVAISFVGNDVNANESGQIRIYKNISGVWTQIGSPIYGEAAYDNLGIALSLFSDASTIAIGTPYNDGNGVDAGHVKVYDLSAVLSDKTLEESQFKLFPNPATHQFTIQLQEGLQLQKVNIYNVLGQFIVSSQENIISSKTLSKGVYIIEIVTNTGKVSKKLVID